MFWNSRDCNLSSRFRERLTTRASECVWIRQVSLYRSDLSQGLLNKGGERTLRMQKGKEDHSWDLEKWARTCVENLLLRDNPSGLRTPAETQE